MEDVVIVGAGPTGLWLAAELRLQGVSATVLEAKREPEPHSKALTLHPRTIEILGMRGIADEFVDAGIPLPTGHFGALDARLDFRGLDTPYPFTLFLPQVRTEELLAAHASDRGVPIHRGHQVTGLDQGPDSVRIAVEGPAGTYELAARYVVGCDGTRSTARTSAGIGFPGTGSTIWGWLADVVLADPPAGAVSAFGPDGGVMAVPMPGGRTRFVGIAPEDHRAEHPGELTTAEVRDKLRRALGTDFGLHSPSWSSRFGNATRQADAYRRGRVLLAGDAAHRHFPTGGVGLNVGFQDATNLGWKLAATLRGTAEPGLLDSYHAERHPVGADLLESTRAQTALMTTGSVEGLALRGFLSGMIREVPEFSRALAERLGALDVRYPAADTAHPLTGRRAPNLAFADGGELFPLLRGGNHVLLDFTAGGADTALPPGTRRHRTELRGAAEPWASAEAVLIRPDGHVAWAIGGDGRSGGAATEQPDRTC
ncbi:FAD-dependent monooxygenase [Saccharopolyspora gregorii]|uniref:FAD-dependent monooxygenase n=1 Tax=Saccharopolyspora gregorii TaxID=33914 RepID=UPI0021AD10E8|nr:FAD-dependent monooxygenase [Saccharopolyspora gregorii]